MHLTLTRSGGMTAASRTWNIETDNLITVDRDRIEAAVRALLRDRNNLNRESHRGPRGPVRDRFNYKLVVSDGVTNQAVRFRESEDRGLIRLLELATTKG